YTIMTVDVKCFTVFNSATHNRSHRSFKLSDRILSLSGHHHFFRHTKRSTNKGPEEGLSPRFSVCHGCRITMVWYPLRDVLVPHRGGHRQSSGSYDTKIRHHEM